MGFQFGKIDRVFGGVPAIHEAHERGEVAIDRGKGRGKKAPDRVLVEAGGGDGMADVEGHLAVGHVDVETADGQAAIGAGNQLDDLLADLRLAREHRYGEVDLQDVVFVRDAQTAGVNGGVPAHGEEDELLVAVRVEIHPGVFEMCDDCVEGSGEVGHEREVAGEK